jgi:hypothetical protein
MPLHLRTTYQKPLEREFEAWIVSGIETYLASVGIKYAIWAVSPNEEKRWPADERLTIGSMLIGLQFKKAKLASGAPGANRLHWTLHNPDGQFSLVKKRPEIFYCLPTFMNRALRTRALDHCIFWRPTGRNNKNVWYDNPNPDVETPYKKTLNSMRWGLFMELLFQGDIGKRITSPEDSVAALRYFQVYMQGQINSLSDTPASEISQLDGALYALAIDVKTKE